MTTTRQLTLRTADEISIEAEVHVPEGASAIVVLAHPHPQYGGSMDGGLIDELFRSLPQRGVGALRFNFRGVGASTGAFADGIGEVHDVAAALAEAAAIAERLADAAASGVPVVLAGWSFGADVSLTIESDAHAAWVLIAPPLRITEPERWSTPNDARPKLVLSPEHDQYRPPASAEEVTAAWTNTEVRPLIGADHFLAGHATAVADHLVGLVETLA